MPAVPAPQVCGQRAASSQLTLSLTQHVSHTCIHPALSTQASCYTHNCWAGCFKPTPTKLRQYICNTCRVCHEQLSPGQVAALLVASAAKGACCCEFSTTPAAQALVRYAVIHQQHTAQVLRIRCWKVRKLDYSHMHDWPLPMCVFKASWHQPGEGVV
jgi:hypothetical protein